MHRIAPFIAAGLLGGWSPLAAQTPPPPPSPTYSSTLVVTASLEPESPADLSATVDVVERHEIERRRAPQVLDLLRTVPGLAAVQSGSPGKVASLFTRGTSSAHTLVVVDGLAWNDPVLGGFDWSALATAGLERVEIVRGPFSSLWGSRAVGGVIQLVTRGAERRSLALDAEAGARELARVALFAAAPLGRFGLDAAAHAREGEGALDNDFFEAREARVRLAVALPGGVRLAVRARSSEEEVGIPADFSGLPSPRRRQSADSRQLALPVDWSNAAWRLEGLAARIDTELELADADDPFAASRSEASREQARATLSRRFSDHLWVAGGAERERERATTASAFGPGLADHRQTSRAGFAQAAWTPGRVRLDLGARRDEHSQFGGETTLRLGGVVELGRASRLRASWGESFRAPALGDLFFPFFGNPDLRPERGRSWELGVERERGGVTARLTGFGSELDDLIQFDLGRNLPFNIGRARIRGLESTVELRRGAWRARADATWLESEDRATGAPLPRRPRWSGSTLVDGELGRWSVGATVRAVGAREDVGRRPLASYTVADLRAARPLSARWRAFARLENLLDRDYEEVTGTPAPGRSWAVGVALRAGE